jgi:hypothetical protein
VYLSINNREEIIKLPVVPKFSIPSPVNNKVFNTISQGDIKLIGLRGLKSITLQSFFPSKDYPFLRDRTYKGWEYVEIIESWIDRRLPIRLIISDTPINMACTIEEFEYSIEDGSGDINYTLTLSEFKFIQLQIKEV